MAETKKAISEDDRAQNTEHQRPKAALTEQIKNREWPQGEPWVLRELCQCTLFVVITKDVGKCWIFTKHSDALAHKRSLPKPSTVRLFGVVPECEAE